MANKAWGKGRRVLLFGYVTVLYVDIDTAMRQHWAGISLSMIFDDAAVNVSSSVKSACEMKRTNQRV